MPEFLCPCPYCGNPNPEIARTPPPATAALLEQAHLIVRGGVGSKWMELLQAFINEWK